MKYDKQQLSERLDRIDTMNFWRLNNIKIGSALSDMGACQEDNITISYILKQYLFSIIEYDYSIEKYGKGNIIFFYSNANRTRQYVQQKMQCVDNLSKSKISVRPNKRKIHFKGFFGLFYIICWYKQFRKLSFERKESLLMTMYIYESYINLCDLLKVLKDNIHNINLVISVHDNRMMDSVVIQYFNNINIDTCTLQHAELLEDDLWLDVGKSFSKQFCVYGDLTYNRAIKAQRHNNNFLKLGMPHMIGIKHKIDRNKTTKKFGVFLDYIGFEKNNIQMILLANEIAEKYNLSFFIKYHPSLKEYDYTDKCSKACKHFYRDEINANDLISDIEFAITSMSSMFGELVYQGIPVIRFIVNNKDVYKGIDYLRISSFDEVNRYYKNSKCTEIFYEEIEKTVELICGLSDPKEAYTKFISQYEDDDNER